MRQVINLGASLLRFAAPDYCESGSPFSPIGYLPGEEYVQRLSFTDYLDLDPANLSFYYQANGATAPLTATLEQVGLLNEYVFTFTAPNVTCNFVIAIQESVYEVIESVVTLVSVDTIAVSNCLQREGILLDYVSACNVAGYSYQLNEVPNPATGSYVAQDFEADLDGFAAPGTTVTRTDSYPAYNGDWSAQVETDQDFTAGYSFVLRARFKSTIEVQFAYQAIVDPGTTVTVDIGPSSTVFSASILSQVDSTVGDWTLVTLEIELDGFTDEVLVIEATIQNNPAQPVTYAFDYYFFDSLVPAGNTTNGNNTPSSIRVQGLIADPLPQIEDELFTTSTGQEVQIRATVAIEQKAQFGPYDAETLTALVYALKHTSLSINGDAAIAKGLTVSDEDRFSSITRLLDVSLKPAAPGVVFANCCI